MLKRPLLVGNRGNMGARYSAIFRALGIDFLTMDLGDELPPGFDSVLIATPTYSHIAMTRVFEYACVPILCEKPFSTDLAAVLSYCDHADKHGIKLEMVNQYAYASAKYVDSGLTYYNYFKTGGDGLLWDTISISALANGPVEIDNKSPIWSCTINDWPLMLSEIDHAYMLMIEAWLSGRNGRFGIPYIRHAHTKVQRMIEAQSDKGVNWDSGTQRLDQASKQSI